MKIIGLLGCGGNAGINFVKSIKLADPNIKIVGFDTDIYNLASSNSDIKILINNTEILNKIKTINENIDKYKIDAIHAQPDSEVQFLCNNKNDIKCYIFDHNIDEWHLFSNKLLCAKKWITKLDLDFTSYSLTDVIENNLLWNNITSKQDKAWIRMTKGAGSRAALPVLSLTDAKNWANYWINTMNFTMKDFMVSEFLPGPEYAVQTFWLNGNMIHAQARERLVYFFGNIMPSGQSSTPAVAVTTKDPNVYNVAKNSILSLNQKPHGIYCVDLKTNINNQIIPMEINYGRFFTTSDFFARLDVNTPYVYIQSILNNNLPKTKVNSIQSGYYWIRAIDKEPLLLSQKEINKLCHK